MGVRSRGTVSALLAVCLLAGLGDPGAAADREEARTDVVVVLRAGAEPVASLASGLVGAHDGEVTTLYEHAVHGFAARVSARAVAGLRRHPAVASIEPDAVVSHAAQEVPRGVQRVFAPANATIPVGRGEEDAVDADIAVLDSGVDHTHPELRVVARVDCRRSGCPRGGDDDNGHGTHVAGIAAARDDGRGVVGTAPGARLWSVKVLDSTGSGLLSEVIRGIDWVTSQADAIEVANLSLASPGTSAGHTAAIAGAVEAGVVVVVAAGNGARDAGGVTPANVPDAMTVSALADYDGTAGGTATPGCTGGTTGGPDDALATFSNYGDVVDIAAPGVCILSTARGGGTTVMRGTSMAAPHVAGAVAVLTSGGRAPSDRAGVLALHRQLRDAGNDDWTDTAPDLQREPLLDLSDSDVFAAAVLPVTEPTVALTAPAAGSVVTGTTTVSASASDGGAGIVKVEFLLDDEVVGTATAPPWAVAFDSSSHPEGPRTLRAVAWNGVGAHTRSAGRSLVVDNVAPTAAVTSPTPGSHVRGLVELAASATDAGTGITAMHLLVDGTPLADATATPASAVWDTRHAGDGAHTVAVRATDGAGHRADHAVAVVVDNTPPSVVLRTPGDGGALRGRVHLEADARDAGGVASVRFAVDGREVAAAGSPPFRAEWDTQGIGDGQATVTATATDLAGNTTTSVPLVVRLANDEPVARRLAGGDRWATAARVSEASFAPGAARVYVATGTDFPDALAAGAVAAASGVPLLLTARTSLPPATAAELRRLQPAEIVVVGGHGAVSPEVEAALAAHAPVHRLRGRDRFDTAAAVARASHPDRAPVVLIASGAGFPDALAAGPAAAGLGGPLLLVARDAVPAATAAALRELAPARVLVLGGAGAVREEVLGEVRSITGAEVVRLHGTDRSATSVAVSAATHPAGADAVVLATGAQYADALAGAPAAAGLRAPLLLVARDTLPGSVAAELRRLRPTDVVVLGGPGAISDATVDAAVDASR